MRTNAPLTIASVTPRLSRVGVSAAGFTIHSIFFAKFSAAEGELVAAFSKRSSVASPDKAKNDKVGRTCVTICRSHWKKRPSVQKRKLKFENSMPATNAAEVEPSPGRAASIVLFVAVEVR